MDRFALLIRFAFDGLERGQFLLEAGLLPETKLLRSKNARGGVFARGVCAGCGDALARQLCDLVFYSQAARPRTAWRLLVVKYASKSGQNPRLEPNSTLKAPFRAKPSTSPEL